MEAILTEAVCACFEQKAESPKNFIAAVFSTNQQQSQDKKSRRKIKKLRAINAALTKKTEKLSTTLENLRKHPAIILPVEQLGSQRKKNVNFTGLLENHPLQSPKTILMEKSNVPYIKKKPGRPKKNQLPVSHSKMKIFMQ